MLADPEVRAVQLAAAPARPYWDRKLLKRRATYVHFVIDLKRRGLLRFTRDPLELVGVFFVSKKSGALRLIIDARRSNAWFRPSRPVTLLTSEGLGSIELAWDEDTPLG